MSSPLYGDDDDSEQTIKEYAATIGRLTRERDELLLWKEGAINFYPDLADMKVGSDE
jgi:hypothetical protein